MGHNVRWLAACCVLRNLCALPLADNHINADDILTGKTMAVQFSNVVTDPWDLCHRLGGPAEKENIQMTLIGEGRGGGPGPVWTTFLLRRKGSLLQRRSACLAPTARLPSLSFPSPLLSSPSADPQNPSFGFIMQYLNGHKCHGANGVVKQRRSLRLWLLCDNDSDNVPDDEVR